MIELNKIYNEECLDTLNRMEDNFLDLTITSPPYNVDLGKNKFNNNPYDLYIDNKDHKEYIEWLTTIFGKIHDKTKIGGRCVINIGDGKNGGIPTHADIIMFMKNLGWIPMTTIMWDKNNVSARTAWGCYSDDIRVMTSNGLKYFKDVDIETDLFATKHMLSGKLQYQRAFDYIERDVDTKIYDIRNKTFDLSVTPDHYIYHVEKKENKLTPLCELLKKSKIVINQRHNGYDGGVEQEYFILPPVEFDKRSKKKYIEEAKKPFKIKMDDWLAFLGIFLTDGGLYISKTRSVHNISIYQKKPSTFLMVKNLLERLPFNFKYKENKNEFVFSSKRLSNYLKQFSQKHNRKVPAFIENLSIRQMNIFIQWMFIGDGHFNKDGSFNSLAVQSEYALQSILTILLKCNYRFSIYKQKPKPHYLNGVLIKSNVELNIIYIRKDNTSWLEKRRNSITEREYKGKIYCVSVPNRTLLVERNGTFTWCGNSFKSPSSPSFPTPFEYILVFAKGNTKLQTTGESDLTNSEFVSWSLAKWNVTGESSKKIGHPAAFPLELPMRCIKMLSWLNAVVYDPFMGSGTTALACKMFERKFIGSEISEEYVKLAEGRLGSILL